MINVIDDNSSMLSNVSSDTKRNSNIELLKIFAIILVVLSHATFNSFDPHPNNDYLFMIDITKSTNNIQLFIVKLFRNMGQIGNAIFLICSAYFLLDSSVVKYKKIICIIGDCFAISIGALILFSLMGYTFSVGYIIKQLLPVTFGNSWFVTCYLLLYAIHPMLNIVINSVNKRMLLRFNLSFFILYNIISFFMRRTLFFYSEIIGFIGVYFFVAYIKKTNTILTLSKKWNVITLLVGIAGWIIMMVVTNVLGLREPLFEYQCNRWNSFINPFFLMIACAIFNIIKKYQFYSKSVNFVSSLSLLIYVIHCNRIWRDYVRWDVMELVWSKYQGDYIVLETLTIAFFTLLVSLAVAIVYKLTFGKVVVKTCDKFLGFVLPIWRKIEDKLVNIE